MLTIAFDLWETLITDTAELARAQEALRFGAMERVLSEAGHPVGRPALEEAYRALWTRCHELYWSADRDVPTSRQIDHFLDALGLGSDLSSTAREELEAAYIHPALDVPPRAVDGALETVRTLRALGHRLGLVSNTGRTPGSVLRLVLQRLGLGEHLEAMVFSNEHGACKPQPSIFRELTDLLQVAPEEVVFVGDNIYCDVWGAQQSGMRGVLFLPPKRGLAVAHPVEHGKVIEPDATIDDLRHLPATLERFRP